MTQENKELLLQDLSARLPYGVICHYNCVTPCDRRLIEKTNTKDVLKGIIPMSDGHIGFMVGTDKVNVIEGDIKPYLRPMSSMTEKEREEFEKISHCFLKTIVLKRDRKCRIVEQKAYFDNEIPSSGAFGDDGDYRYIKQEYFVNLINWLNEHHLDYRGLIEQDLAIAVTKENNPYE